MLGAFDDDVVAERGAEQVELRPAEVLARRRRGADRAVVLDEHEVTVVVVDDLGEVALVGADARQRFDARAQAAARSGSPARYAASCVSARGVDDRGRARPRRARAGPRRSARR